MQPAPWCTTCCSGEPTRERPEATPFHFTAAPGKYRWFLLSGRPGHNSTFTRGRERGNVWGLLARATSFPYTTRAEPSLVHRETMLATQRTTPAMLLTTAVAICEATNVFGGTTDIHPNYKQRVANPLTLLGLHSRFGAKLLIMGLDCPPKTGLRF